MRTPLPTITFGNVRSIRNKIDELSGNCKYIHEYRDSALIALTETWLQDQDADSTVNVDGFKLIRSDRRDVDKERGGGVAVYVNERWCSQVIVKESHCVKDIEYLVVSCRPFYLPREFCKVDLFIVYIPPDADESAAAEILENCINKYENESPESVKIILGDFNHCDFQENVPTYVQTVQCVTRGNRTLDKLYCNIKESYRVFKRPPLGNGDHNMLFCVPIYKQVLKREKCEQVTIRKWDDESSMKLQSCFECTDWSVLIENGADINTNVDILNSYFLFCLDMLVPTKVIKIYPNNKPWVTKELKVLLNEKRRYMVNGDSTQQKAIQKRINKKIADSKKGYKEKIEGLFKTHSVKDAWKGLKTLCGHEKKISIPEPEDTFTYVNEMNSFFARFERYDFRNECNVTMSAIRNITDERILITEECVLQSLKRVRAGKATGPDGVPARALKCCAVQLAPVLRTLFQDSIDQGVVPIKWKESEIKPIAKVKFPKVFNDYRPVVLTSNIMKCLEDILRNFLCNSVGNMRDPLQFAYCKNRSVQDASITLVNDISKHLDKINTQVRILYVDFSSAFNTIQPHILLNKLMGMGVNSYILKWIFNFLSQRPQYTTLGNVKSNILYTSTGAPQGCVMSPVLFSLYTDDCRSAFSNCAIIKYADDTVIIGKILNDECDEYVAQVHQFVDWCRSNFLQLNIKKTKEMIIDYRTKKCRVPDPIVIDAEIVERVGEYKYLGFVIDDQLKGYANTSMVVKKCNQRLHFLRILNNLHIDKNIISLFYKSTIESILSFSLTTWYGKLTSEDKRKLNRIVRKSRKLGAETNAIDKLYQERTMMQVDKIMKDTSHPLRSCYVFLRSGRRLALPAQRTERYKKSFVPKSIVLYNHLK